ncbi:hypothetical protein [Bacillus sinesaloumensis]|uniref:hypothetical protein n=1 Tax=Litchfieldia sinesaloumensis TaxID=1926280 RepID=UPI0009883D13|nr:hypothetical protein [Bacillus sinesaloumensis]
MKVEDLVVRKERLVEIVSLLVTHDIKRINEEFYDLISGNNENPFGLDWEEYDSLAPTGGDNE